MGFTEQTFLFIFMPVTILGFIALSRIKKSAWSNVWLLVISVGTYAWAGRNTLIFFLLLMVVVYFLGVVAFASREYKTKTKGAIFISMSILVGVLFYYKYASFVMGIINRIGGTAFSIKQLYVPIGISFVIFSAISYVVDIYRGDAEPGSLLDAMLFLSFFPKLVSGPIVQWKHFQQQLVDRKTSLELISSGINRIIIGYAKRVIIADTFGAQIMLINAQVSIGGADTPTFWLRSLLYFFQIYYDFSGYSDIAIGLSKVFGFTIHENFNFPYISKSITEFWRRWHISLGTWFREYVYIPMGGNRTGNVYLNLFVVFLLTGIWHGANWTFIAWGVINGVFIVFERIVSKSNWYVRIPGLIKQMVTCVLVYFMWIPFMSTGIREAVYTVRSMFCLSPTIVNFTWQLFLSRKISVLLVIAAVGAFAGALKAPELMRKWARSKQFQVIKQMGLIALFAVDILFVVNSSYSPFMYFQF